MAKAIGVDPASRVTLPDLDDNSTDRRYADAHFKYIVSPSLVDYPWPDSQNISTWTNGLYERYGAAAGRRPLVLSRYGGLGDQRKPIGFSGDTEA